MSEGIVTKPLMSKEALIKRIESSYNELQLAYQSFDEVAMLDPLGEGDWAIKDILAHIASWEDILVRFHIGGEPFEQVIELDGARYRETTFDEVNDHLYERYKELSLEHAKALLEETHARVIKVLDSFPEDQLHQAHPQLSIGEYSSLNWIDYIVANTYEHYEEHLASLLKS
jgi:hypothetical protein